MRRLLLPVALLSFLFAAPALADRGALSLDLGGGFTGIGQAAPYAPASSRLLGGAPLVMFGARYALTNNLEFSLHGFYEPQVSYTHDDVTVVTPDGAFPGAESHTLYREGALVGAEYVKGLVWRFRVGLEAGWSHRSMSSVHAYDTSSSLGAVDYGLQLADVGVNNLVLAPSAGLEWDFSDHMSVTVQPRLELLVGQQPTFAISLPLLFSYSFYL